MQIIFPVLHWNNSTFCQVLYVKYVNWRWYKRRIKKMLLVSVAQTNSIVFTFQWNQSKKGLASCSCFCILCWPGLGESVHLCVSSCTSVLLQFSLIIQQFCVCVCVCVCVSVLLGYKGLLSLCHCINSLSGWERGWQVNNYAFLRCKNPNNSS